MKNIYRKLNQKEADKSEISLIRITQQDGSYIWNVSRSFVPPNVSKNDLLMSKLDQVTQAILARCIDPVVATVIVLKGTWRQTIWDAPGDDYKHEWKVLYPTAKEGMVLVFNQDFVGKYADHKFPVFGVGTQVVMVSPNDEG